MRMGFCHKYMYLNYKIHILQQHGDAHAKKME